MRKIYYLGYLIYEVGNEFVVDLDNSFHKTLISAKCHIDYLTK
jgi:hypothetical protein